MAPASKRPGELSPADRIGWQFHSPQNDLAQQLREELLALAANAIAGNFGLAYHRSRRASTWRASAGGAAELQVYIKLMRPPRGMARIKRIIKGPHGAYLEAITQALNDAGFGAPPILLRGTERHGTELIVTLAAGGDGPMRVLAELSEGRVARKRVVLRGIGRELARLHRCGFIHGDLTPFNLFLIRGEPLRVALIDNDRTRRKPLLLGRRTELRNLVQLGRFALKGISRSDKLRVMHGYTEMMNPHMRNAVTRRASVMLNRRLRRDGGLTAVAARPETPASRDERKGIR